MERLQLLVTFVVLVLGSSLVLCSQEAETAESDPSSGSSAAVQCSQTSITLLGANGDLAKRYLWQAIFDFYVTHRRSETGRPSGGSENSGNTVVAVSGTRKALSSDDLRQLVGGSISCADDPAVSAEDCATEKKEFLNSVLGVQLKGSGDYESLDHTLKELASVRDCMEQRLFYLAIPAFAFKSSAEYIGTKCRPKPQQGSWLRVVFEKPFGHDLASSQDLIAGISQYLHDSEILLIDHYLGKTGVMAIQDLRSLLSPLGSRLWSKAAVTKVEVSVNEKLDAAGRTQFYDSYGVVCDMLQNHLTSIMILVACQMDGGMECSHQSRMSVLDSVQPICPAHALLGQYDTYREQVCADSSAMCGTLSRTATYASVLLRIASAGWHGVPFVLQSGKAMDERWASIVLHLQPKAVNSSCQEPRLTLNIQGGSHGTSLLVPHDISSLLFTSLPAGWIWSDSRDIEGCQYRLATPLHLARPYSELLQSAVLRPSGRFVDAESLLASWRVWSEAVGWLPYLPLRLYSPESVRAGHLQTLVSGSTLHFALSESEDFTAEHTPTNSHAMKHGELFLGGIMHVGRRDELSSKIIAHIAQLARAAVSERASFHIAFPGGTSPRALMLALSSNAIADRIPWRNVHVWQVDERCADPVERRDVSNFQQLSAMLLQHRPVLLEHIHRMPVLLASGVCVPADSGSAAYSAQLSLYNNATLDLVLLGVGQDGHVASLFPASALADFTGDTALVEQGNLPTAPRRMTLTYQTLWRVRSALFLVMGSSKSKILHELASNIENFALPAAKVALNRAGETVWYVDTAAAAQL